MEIESINKDYIVNLFSKKNINILNLGKTTHLDRNIINVLNYTILDVELKILIYT